MANNSDNLIESIQESADNKRHTTRPNCQNSVNLNREEIAALAGLAPFNHDSGEFSWPAANPWRTEPPIESHAVHGGPNGQALQRETTAFAETFWHKAGKPFKVVITACMRKLLTILNTLIHSGQTVDATSGCGTELSNRILLVTP